MLFSRVVDVFYAHPYALKIDANIREDNSLKRGYRNVEVVFFFVKIVSIFCMGTQAASFEGQTIQ
jgi:hypothetical protein